MSSPIETEIVEHLRSGPAGMRPLLARRPRASVYAALARLRERGAVVPGARAGTWRLVDADEPPAAAPPPTSLGWPGLPFPHLAHMPSPAHRAVPELVLLSRLVRLSYERHHGSYVLYSARGLKGKTFTLAACALMLGLEPESVVHAGFETRGSLGVRRRSTGEVAGVRAALTGPLVAIDEKGRGSRQAQEAVELLLHGHRTVPLENGQRLDLAAVVMVALNSPDGAADVQAATGLDEPMQRRCHLARLDDVELDPAFAADGEERLERLRQLGPVQLPEPGDRAVEGALGEQIARALPQVLDAPERAETIDVVMLRQEAVAATWLGLTPADAVALVLHRSALLWATTNWTAPCWEQRLAAALGRDRAAEAPAACPVAVVTPAADDAALDFEARLAELDRVARAHGAGEPAVLDERLRLAAVVHEVGLGPDAAPGLRALLELVRGPQGEPGERLRLLADLDDMDVAADAAARHLRAAEAARRVLGLEPEEVAAVPNDGGPFAGVGAGGRSPRRAC